MCSYKFYYKIKNNKVFEYIVNWIGINWFNFLKENLKVEILKYNSIYTMTRIFIFIYIT